MEQTTGGVRTGPTDGPLESTADLRHHIATQRAMPARRRTVERRMPSRTAIPSPQTRGTERSTLHARTRTCRRVLDLVDRLPPAHVEAGMLSVTSNERWNPLASGLTSDRRDRETVHGWRSVDRRHHTRRSRPACSELRARQRPIRARRFRRALRMRPKPLPRSFGATGGKAVVRRGISGHNDTRLPQRQCLTKRSCSAALSQAKRQVGAACPIARVNTKEIRRTSR